MDILRAEIERKRKETVAAPSGRNKYVKRGDADRIAAAAASSAVTVNPPPANPIAAVKHSPSTADDQTIIAETDIQADAQTDVQSNAPRISEAELVTRLRARGVPIRLFAEDFAQRVARLKVLESSEIRSEGQQNDFRQLLAKADDRLAQDFLERKAGGEGLENKQESRKRDLEAALEKIDTRPISNKLASTDPEKNRYLIGAYFKKILLIWERTLNERSDNERSNTQGRLAMATRAQTAEYLKPFFGQLKRGSLESDVIARVTEICMYMQQREYLKANDSYLRLSIGNAPWPIGVTMVGIHERSGREKISSSQVAHGLNDETQRKWIQSIKRLMTFAQSIWPPDDLGKAVG
ncbi:mRNA splicing protein prp18 [Physocladia obscura]|uniref:Pre-mRNA-splicing factor 18 n=1 Tax=Physocladia obscura TaxID=109957 RepID=A0AAD5T660_9FUNG|nr:mRNA splicing protein prp18 [Physocladia obscura]